MTRLWHPFAAMGAVEGAELVIARGQGARVWDADGREYLDATAALWFANVGHGRAELAAAAAQQMKTLAAHQCFGDVANEPARALAERVAELSPLDDAAVFFGSGGSDAVDTAGKIARRYWSLLDQPERQVIVSRQFAYHGVNAYGTSLGGIAANREGFGTLVEDVLVVADDDPTIQALRAELRPDRPEVDGILGTQALATLELDLDYQHDRALGRCTDELQCVARPELSSTARRESINNCIAIPPGPISRQ